MVPNVRRCRVHSLRTNGRRGLALFETVVAAGLAATMIGFSLQAYVMCYRLADRTNGRLDRLQMLDEFTRTFRADVMRSRAVTVSQADRGRMTLSVNEGDIAYQFMSDRKTIERQAGGHRDVIGEGIASVVFDSLQGSQLVRMHVRIERNAATDANGSMVIAVAARNATPATVR